MDLRYTFNEDVSLYDRYRPDYPQALYDDIFNYSHLLPNSQAIEIGIGTGQATLPILNIGIYVKAIELGENLAHFTQYKYQAYQHFEVIVGDFLDIQLPKQTCQLIYSATAFHWLDPKKAFPKVLDVLTSGGTLALFWNHPFIIRADDPLHQKIRAIYKEYKPNDNRDLREFDGHTSPSYCEQIKQYGFVDVESKLYHRTRTMNADEYIGLLNTYSDHRSLDAMIKAPLEQGIHEAIMEADNRIYIYDTIDLYLAKKA